MALWGHRQSQGDQASLDFCKKVIVTDQTNNVTERLTMWYSERGLMQVVRLQVVSSVEHGVAHLVADSCTCMESFHAIGHVL